GAWPFPYKDRAPPASESKASGMGRADSRWADTFAPTLLYGPCEPKFHPGKTLAGAAVVPPSPRSLTVQKHDRSIVPLPAVTNLSVPGCTLLYGRTTFFLLPAAPADAYKGQSKSPPADRAPLPRPQSLASPASAIAARSLATSPRRCCRRGCIPEPWPVLGPQ